MRGGRLSYVHFFVRRHPAFSKQIWGIVCHMFRIRCRCDFGTRPNLRHAQSRGAEFPSNTFYIPDVLGGPAKKTSTDCAELQKSSLQRMAEASSLRQSMNSGGNLISNVFFLRTIIRIIPISKSIQRLDCGANMMCTRGVSRTHILVGLLRRNGANFGTPQ